MSDGGHRWRGANGYRAAPWLVRLEVAALLGFVALLAFVRPALEGRELPVPVAVVVWSLPNLIEAIVGMALLGTAAEMLRLKYRPTAARWAAQSVAGAAALLYVVPQEFGLHRLGGFNVVDPWDAAFSVVGVAAMAIALARLGPIREKSETR